jgi:hypothetical protein
MMSEIKHEPKITTADYKPKLTDGVAVLSGTTGPLTINANSVLYSDYVFRNTLTGEEMLRISNKGFFVRGVNIEQNEKEAEEVYKIFRQYLNMPALR